MRRKGPSALVAAIVLLALFLSYSSVSNLFGLRPILITAVYPFQLTANFLWKGITGAPASLAGLRDLAKENAELKERQAMLLSKLSFFDELRAENERLKAALGFQKYGYRFNLLPAEVIARGGDPRASILEINRGASAGVRVNMPVVAKDGLVGKVIEVSPFSSRVRLITDPLSSVAAADQRSREFGIAEGFSPDRLLLRYVATSADVKEGDRIVTSPISSVFPSGIPIGTVTRASKKEHALFYQVEIKPFVRLSQLEEVFLIR